MFIKEVMPMNFALNEALTSILLLLQIAEAVRSFCI